jgi:hypothetical protein
LEPQDKVAGLGAFSIHGRERVQRARDPGICLHRKKINISTVLAGQKLGITEVDDGI